MGASVNEALDDPGNIAGGTRSHRTLPSFPINLAVRETPRLFSQRRGRERPARGASTPAFPIVEGAVLKGVRVQGSPAPRALRILRAALHKLPVGQKGNANTIGWIRTARPSPVDNGLLARPNISDSQVAFLKGLLCIFLPRRI